MSITIIRVQPPVTDVIGTEWLRRFTYSKNILVGNSEAYTWITLVPGSEEIILSPEGTGAERFNYLIGDANNITTDRSLTDFVNNNLIQRS